MSVLERTRALVLCTKIANFGEKQFHDLLEIGGFLFNVWDVRLIVDLHPLISQYAIWEPFFAASL